MGGGGGSTAVPAWIFGDSTANVMHKYWDQGKLNLSADFGTPGAQSNFSMQIALLQLLQGDTPYYDGDVDEIKSAFDPDPSGDSEKVVTERERLFPAMFERLSDARDVITDSLLQHNLPTNTFLGMKTVSNRISNDVQTHIMDQSDTDDLFDPAHYDVASLVSGIITTALTDAGAALTEATGVADTEFAAITIDPQAEGLSDANDSLDAADTKVKTKFTNSGGTGVMSKARIEAGSVSSASISLIDGDSSKTPLTNAISTGSDNVELEIEQALSVIVDATTGLQSVITAALSAADGSLNSSMVDNAVDAFDGQIEDKHTDAINRMSETMVDINAVYGSVYILGLAKIEQQHLREVASYRANLELQIYDRVYQSYITMFGQTLNGYLNMEMDLIKERLANYRMLSSTYAQNYMHTFLGYLESYVRMVVHFGDIEKSSADKKSATYNLLLQMHNQFANTWGQNHIRQAVHAKLNRLGVRDTHVGMQYGTQSNMLSYGLTAKAESDKVLMDLQKSRYLANNAILERDLELQRADRMWRFDMMGKAINYLGVATGVATVPEKPSNLEKALGIGLSVASIGAKLFPNGFSTGSDPGMEGNAPGGSDWNPREGNPGG